MHEAANWRSLLSLAKVWFKWHSDSLRVFQALVAKVIKEIWNIEKLHFCARVRAIESKQNEYNKFKVDSKLAVGLRKIGSWIKVTLRSLINGLVAFFSFITWKTAAWMETLLKINKWAFQFLRDLRVSPLIFLRMYVGGHQIISFHLVQSSVWYNLRL